jgi:amidase
MAGRSRGPLDGIPIAHKDIYCTKGLSTTAHSKILQDHVPDEDAGKPEFHHALQRHWPSRNRRVRRFRRCRTAGLDPGGRTSVRRQTVFRAVHAYETATKWRKRRTAMVF